MDSIYLADFPNPMESFTQGFHGSTPHDLSDVVLELASIASRSSAWRAHGIIQPETLTELNAVGVITKPVEIHLMAHLVHSDGPTQFRLQGRCWGEIELNCVRCLIDFKLPLTSEIDAFFALGTDRAIKNKRWQIDEDVVFLPDGMLKLNHLTEEELLLALPMNPICVPGCAGLCAGCGADLNQAPCCCRQSKPTGPFAVLETLKSA